MDRRRALACRAVGAIALAMATAAAGGFDTTPVRSPDMVPVSSVTALGERRTPAPDDEQHHGAQPTPSPAPTGQPGASPDASTPPPDPDEMDMDHPAHGEEMASQHPGDDGHADDGHGAQPSGGHEDAESGHEEADGGHEEAEGGHEDTESGHGDAEGGHEDTESGHEVAEGGHGDAEPVGERPREILFGGFFAVNALAVAGAAVLRRRDRAAALGKAARTSSTATPTDPSR